MIIEKPGLIFLRACVGQGRVPDAGDLKLILRDFSQLQSENTTLKRYVETHHDEDFVMWSREQDALLADTQEVDDEPE